jgi:hypothetical protein
MQHFYLIDKLHKKAKKQPTISQLHKEQTSLTFHRRLLKLYLDYIWTMLGLYLDIPSTKTSFFLGNSKECPRKVEGMPEKCRRKAKVELFARL